MTHSAFPDITSKEIKEYCKKYSSNQNPSLDLIEKLSQSTHDPKMISGPFLGKFLSIVSMIKQPKFILELGTFTGYGTLCLSEGLVDGGKIITIEKNPEMKDFATEIFGDKNDKIIQLIGDASQIIPQLDYTFDLVFIDAAKRKYIQHFDLILPKLNHGGIVLADNVLWKGKVVSENNDKLGQGLHDFNQYIHTHPAVDNVIIPIDDGVNLIFKK